MEPEQETQAETPLDTSQFIQGMPGQPHEPRDTLTVVEMVTHQQHGIDPTQTETRFQRILKGVEQQPYSRQCRVGEEWKPLDHGWVEKVGHLLIRNHEGDNLRSLPTPEEQAELDSKNLLISFSDDIARVIVLPGESCRFHPTFVEHIRVRSNFGFIRFTVTVLPE